MLTVSLSVGGAVFAGCERRSSNTQTSNTTTPEQAAQDSKAVANKDEAARTAGSTVPGDQIGVADLTLIYHTLGEATEAAFTRGGFDDLVERLSKPDRDRIGDFAKQTFADLDGLADELNKSWKAKYGSDFDMDNKAFENWAVVQKAGESSDKTHANVMIPASHGMPALTVPVVKDALVWRIDAPDDVTGPMLKQSLMNHLTAIKDQKDRWPGDKLEGQRFMAHHVLSGVMNKPVAK
jgi:hypothetical protein